MRYANALRQAYRSASRRWVWPFRLAVSVLLLAFAYHELSKHAYNWHSLLPIDTSGSVWFAIAAVLLVVPNLGLETVKWRYILAPHLAVSYKAAWRSILVGQTLGFITPSRLGEYAGRLWPVPAQFHATAGWATFVCRLAQLSGALLGAAVASFALALEETAFPFGLKEPLYWSLLGGGLLFGTAVIALLGTHPGIIASVLRFTVGRLLHFVNPYLEAAGTFQLRRLYALQLLGFVRYLVFVLQFWLLLKAYDNAASPALALQFCGLLFLLKSLIPSIALAELGIRETLALAVAGWLLVPPVLAFNATLGLFIVNLLIPALLGLFFLGRQPNASKQEVVS